VNEQSAMPGQGPRAGDTTRGAARRCQRGRGAKGGGRGRWGSRKTEGRARERNRRWGGGKEEGEGEGEEEVEGTSGRRGGLYTGRGRATGVRAARCRIGRGPKPGRCDSNSQTTTEGLEMLLVLDLFIPLCCMLLSRLRDAVWGQE
jgi:hypothetical protein